jgi:uncharacterized protein
LVIASAAVRADAELLSHMPGRSRLLAECGLILAIFFGTPLALGAAGPGAAGATLTAVLVLLGAWALALTWRRPLIALLAVAGTLTAAWTIGARGPSAPPRLGVDTADRDGCALVSRVVPGRPADGVIAPGDCITAVAGQPLDPRAPTAALRARLQDEAGVPAGEATVTLERSGATRAVTVRLGGVVRSAQLAAADLPWLLLRSAGLLVLVAALLSADGQGARHVGLDPRRLGPELLWSGPVLVGAYATNIAVSLPIGLVLALLDRTQSVMSERLGALSGVLGDLRFATLIPTLVVLALLEEVVFRGFLLPRARVLTGRWWVAVAVVQLLFGLGHLYEGALAVFQTMMLGVYFSAVFLWRRHLGAVIVAHAAFNTFMLATLWFLQRSGVLERLPPLR